MARKRSFDPRTWNLFAAAALSLAACGDDAPGQSDLGEDTAADSDGFGYEDDEDSGEVPTPADGDDDDDGDDDGDDDDGYGYGGDCGDGDGDECEYCSSGSWCTDEKDCEPMIPLPECEDSRLVLSSTAYEGPGQAREFVATPEGPGLLQRDGAVATLSLADGTSHSLEGEFWGLGAPRTRWVDVDGDGVDEAVTTLDGALTAWRWTAGLEMEAFATTQTDSTVDSTFVVRDGQGGSPAMVLRSAAGWNGDTLLLSLTSDGFVPRATLPGTFGIHLGPARDDGFHAWVSSGTVSGYLGLVRHLVDEESVTPQVEVGPTNHGDDYRVASLLDPATGLEQAIAVRPSDVGVVETRIDHLAEPESADAQSWWKATYYVDGPPVGTGILRHGGEDWFWLATRWRSVHLIRTDEAGGLCRITMPMPEIHEVVAGDWDGDGDTELLSRGSESSVNVLEIQSLVSGS